MDKKTSVVLRPKGQVTIPRGICERFGLKAGDVLEMRVENGNIVAVPRKARACLALADIREAFRKAGVTDHELAAAAVKARQEVTRVNAEA